MFLNHFPCHLDPIKAATQHERMEDARRRWQEQQDAKAAKYIEDKKLVSIIIIFPILFVIFWRKYIVSYRNLAVYIHIACTYIQFKAYILMPTVSMVYFILVPV